MRTFTILALLLIPFLPACSSIAPTAATSTVMNGVEVWTSGTPVRPYRVIDTVQRSGPNQSATYADEEALIAQEAHKRGADAIIVTSAVLVAVRQDVAMNRPILAPKVAAELIQYQ